MNKYEKHKKICEEMNDLYIRKNKDYGDSFGISFKEEGMAMPRIRLTDKLNRFKQLSRGAKQHVTDESMRDTLIDIANYAIMTIIEMEMAGKEDDHKLDAMRYTVEQFKEEMNSLKFETERCTMLTCFYNDGDCNCTCTNDNRDPDKLDDCPSFMED